MIWPCVHRIALSKRVQYRLQPTTLSLRAEIHIGDSRPTRLCPCSTGRSVSRLFEGRVPSPDVAARQKAAVDAVYHSVTEAALIDNQSRRSDRNRLHRRESERLPVSHAHNGSGPSHQGRHLRGAEAWGYPQLDSARFGVLGQTLEILWGTPSHMSERDSAARQH